MITVQADHDDVHVPRAFRDASAALRLQTIRDAEFRDDPELRAAIWNLIQHRYDDPTALLDREFDRCDTLYLVRNISGELLSFQMVSWETIGVDGDEVPTVRIGLLATSGGYVEELSVIQLYRLLFQDVRDREARLGREVVVWATTANPGVFLGFQLLYRDAQPARDGGYTPRGEAIARGLRRLFDTEQDSATHPFYLRSVAHRTRYSDEEARRNARLCRKKRFRLFDELNVDESRGDRLLIVGYVPRETSVASSVAAPASENHDALSTAAASCSAAG